MHTFSINGKTISVFSNGGPEAPMIYLNTYLNEGKQIFETLRKANCPPFTLVAISNLDWNRDMVPWDSPPVFRNAEPFAGGADAYLRLLTETIIPEVEHQTDTKPQWRGIAGYSLAGLFALYAICQTEAFSRAGSISGSLWFPGAKEYIISHQEAHTPDCVYLSLGDKESKTRNPILSTVQEQTEEIHAFYQSRQVDTIFQLNPGNHNSQPAQRTAAGIAWMLSR